MTMTRYGAPKLPLASAAAWLRARASAAGTELRPAADVDLAAAVIAAESWSVLTGGSLATPRHSGPVAVAVAAAILARSAGYGEAHDDADLAVIAASCTDRTDHLLAEVEGLAAWAVQLHPTAPSRALRLAAADLTAGGERSPFVEFAALLVLAADQLR
jgi:hypothetical protein